MDVEDEQAAAAAAARGPPAAEEEDDEEAPLNVVKDYKRPAARAGARAGGAYDPSKFAVSPITGELVQIEHMAEHMRVSLIDPRWAPGP